MSGAEILNIAKLVLIFLPFIAILMILIFAALLKPVVGMVTGVFRRRQAVAEVSDTQAAGNILFLVHGTWAKDACWTLPGSALRESIRTALSGDVTFTRFLWSGRNTISARVSATKRLNEALRASLGKYPSANHFVVAHSHGGNIAIRALSHDVRERTRLICLSTPFFVVGRHSFNKLIYQSLAFIPVLIASIGAAILAEAGMVPDSPLTLIVAMGLGGLLTWALRYVTRIKTKALFRNLLYPRLDHNKVLLVRTVRDEASVGLATLQLFSGVVAFITDFTTRFLHDTLAYLDRITEILQGKRKLLVAALFVSVITAVVGAVRAEQDGESGGILLMAALLAGAVSYSAMMVSFGSGLVKLLIWLTLSFVLIPILVLLTLAALAVGYELWLSVFALNVSAESTPPGRWALHNISNKRREEGGKVLQHSLSYQDLESLAVISGWIRENSLSCTRMCGDAVNLEPTPSVGAVALRRAESEVSPVRLWEKPEIANVPMARRVEILNQEQTRMLVEIVERKLDFDDARKAYPEVKSFLEDFYAKDYNLMIFHVFMTLVLILLGFSMFVVDPWWIPLLIYPVYAFVYYSVSTRWQLRQLARWMEDHSGSRFFSS